MQNEFSITNSENCPGNQSVQVFINVENSTGFSNLLVYSGFFNVSKNVPGPLELIVDINRCDSSMKQCEKYPAMKIPALCQKLKDKRTFYYGVLSDIVPPFECPLKAQVYSTNHSSIGLSFLALIPTTGYKWITTTKVFSGRDREVALCFSSELKTVRAKGRKRN